MSRLLLIWVQKPFSQREGETNTSIMIFPTKTSNIDRNLSDQNFRAQPLSTISTDTHTLYTVQYLVQACRPTRELTTERELVRSVVPSTSVSWCVWHIDHARHMELDSRLTGRFPNSHTTRTRHFHRLTLSPYAQILCSTYIFNHNPVLNG